MNPRKAMQLEPDGERMVVEYYKRSASDYLIYLFHEVGYRFAQARVKGADVLDLGCGSGYGSAMLAEVAGHVTGADVSPSAVAHARREFSRPNLTFTELPATSGLPFEDQRFDAVVCFQVIEHVADDRHFVREIARVLRPGGVAILATPDRSTRLFAWQKPWNRWHLREYSGAGLEGLLKSAFGEVEMLFMSGTPSVIEIELKRCRRLRWATIPFTLPALPHRLRFWGLSLLRLLSAKTSNSEPAAFNFGLEDLSIGKNPARSVNLLAVAHKPRI
jgi:SAM-dependent methyltransferase